MLCVSVSAERMQIFEVRESLQPADHHGVGARRTRRLDARSGSSNTTQSFLWPSDMTSGVRRAHRRGCRCGTWNRTGVAAHPSSDRAVTCGGPARGTACGTDRASRRRLSQWQSSCMRGAASSHPVEGAEDRWSGPLPSPEGRCRRGRPRAIGPYVRALGPLCSVARLRAASAWHNSNQGRARGSGSQ